MKALFSLLVAGFVVGDAGAQLPSRAQYEQVLFPVIRPLNGRPGANASIWVTDVFLHNFSSQPVEAFQSACAYFCTCEQPQCPKVPLPPHSGGRAGFNPDFFNEGAFYYIEKTQIENVGFQLRVRDRSREAASFGTEVPIVRERDYENNVLRLLDVPLDARFRQHLRLYGISAPTPDAALIVRVYTPNGTVPIAERHVTLRAPFAQPVAALPADAFPQHPAYAEIAPLTTLITTADERIRVEVVPATPGLVFWAFISVTNNETQHVTLITPQ